MKTRVNYVLNWLQGEADRQPVQSHTGASDGKVNALFIHVYLCITLKKIIR